MHELKLIVDLMYRGGLNYMRHSISDTAGVGRLPGRPRLITADTKTVMKRLLTEIQERGVRQEMDCRERGRHARTTGRCATGRDASVEIGARCRNMMPFLDPGAAAAAPPQRVSAEGPAPPA
jgi:ketol-acid reductoisomerase